jgi:hypothetical protein
MLLCVSLSAVSCGKLKVVEKTELGLTFVIPEDFERTYTYYADIEYGNGKTAFFADVMPYSELELTSSATVRECTEKILDNMNFGGVNITYNDDKKIAQFDAWASDEEGLESYYNYVVVLLGKSNVYIARYVCPGDEKSMKKYTEDFATMAASLSAK